MILWSLLGCILSIALAGAAWLRSRSPGGYYDRSVYGMTHAIHRRYAIAALGLAALFAGIAVSKSGAILMPAFAAFALLAVFYGTSFLRGFTDDDV